MQQAQTPPRKRRNQRLSKTYRVEVGRSYTNEHCGQATAMRVRMLGTRLCALVSSRWTACAVLLLLSTDVTALGRASVADWNVLCVARWIALHMHESSGHRKDG